jgi:hypothetical protein
MISSTTQSESGAWAQAHRCCLGIHATGAFGKTNRADGEHGRQKRLFGSRASLEGKDGLDETCRLLEQL